MMLKTGRGFRVALDSNPSQRKGIFATDLADLRAKTIERFKLGKSAKTLSFYLEDFTEVEDDEYFDSIPGILRIFSYDYVCCIVFKLVTIYFVITVLANEALKIFIRGTHDKHFFPCQLVFFTTHLHKRSFEL